MDGTYSHSQPSRTPDGTSASPGFIVVNAFGDEPFTGNPAAVFPDARGIPEEHLLPIARQLNLVKTVFLYPSPEPGVDYHLRYFMPEHEVPVAGHPTIAAWTALGFLGAITVAEPSRFTQSNLAGKQEIRIEPAGGRLRVSMQQPAPRFTEIITDREKVADVFGISTEDFLPDLPIIGVDAGLGHLVAPLRSLEALMRVRCRVAELRDYCRALGLREAQLFCLETYRPGMDLHTRNICPREGLEDPACGNGTGALGAYLAKFGGMTAQDGLLRAEQGHIVNMPSVIEITIEHRTSEDFTIWIGGGGVVMLEGRMLI